MENVLYEADDLIRVAKRENNLKRSYLYVNPLQGKHIPVSPGRSFALFGLMAEELEKSYAQERLLLIGFAETATAIGSFLACRAGNVKYYMNTTREDVPGAEYLFFSEAHSHATEQRLVKNGLERVMADVDRIVFAEDEVTTGKTIEKLICALRDEYGCTSLKFGIISILNSMSEERLRAFAEQGIDTLYVHRIPEGYRTDEIDQYEYLTSGGESGGDPAESEKTGSSTEVCGKTGIGPAGSAEAGSDPAVSKAADSMELCIGGYWNGRVVCDTDTIREKTAAFSKKLIHHVSAEASGSVLLLGTEECMFPAMLAGKQLEECFPGICVRTHSTTRSPIEISTCAGYPLYNRSRLISLYDGHRKTFLYNLAPYDRVVIVTDADPLCRAGLDSLLDALRKAGSRSITVVRWREEP